MCAKPTDGHVVPPRRPHCTPERWGRGDEARAVCCEWRGLHPTPLSPSSEKGMPEGQFPSPVPRTPATQAASLPGIQGLNPQHSLAALRRCKIEYSPRHRVLREKKGRGRAEAEGGGREEMGKADLTSSRSGGWGGGGCGEVRGGGSEEGGTDISEMGPRSGNLVVGKGHL